MARTSRKAATRETATSAPLPERIYNAAVYVRLSVEGEDREKNQESIAMQQYMLEKYVEAQPDMRLIGIFRDNGETGTNFDRPGFEQMMDEVRNRKVDCIVVKDLSRFGRNYVETGYYLEKIFPYMDVRFVAVNDGYDTSKDGNDEMLLSLKNLVNDLYAKDISQKISSTFATMRKNGELTSGLPPFGYQRSPENKRRLAIDPETAPIVREIFQWRLEGLGMAQIARRLNERKIPCPSMYHYLKGYKRQQPSAGVIWRDDSVRFLMQNPVYAGHMAQGKMRQSLSAGMPVKRLPREEWTVVEHTHEAIVDQETFDKVQEINEQHRQASLAIRGKYATAENIFKGLLVCADCGRKMIRHKSVSPRGIARYVFICRVYAQNLDGQGCTIKSIGEPELTECVLQALRVQVELAVELERLLRQLQAQPEFNARRRQLADGIGQVQQRIKRNTALRSSLFESYSDHILTETEYLSMKAQYEKEAEELKGELARFQEKERLNVHTISPQNEWITALKKYQGEKAVTREMALELINCIRISGYNEIEIVWNFQDEFARLFHQIGKEAG